MNDQTKELRKLSRRRMASAVERMQEYMRTYDTQYGYQDYSDETFINDMLYGIGVSLEPNDHKFADGFRKFKEQLKKHLEDDK